MNFKNTGGVNKKMNLNFLLHECDTSATRTTQERHK